MFVSLANNVDYENNDVKTILARENIDKDKSILGAPLILKRKILKTLGLRRTITKSLNRSISVITVELLDILDLIATHQSNSMISSENQNQFPSFFAPLGDLLKAFIFLSNLNCFNSSLSPPD